MVREARSKGLKAPVMLMGYYNPLLSYGEARLLQDCKEAGVNGFIVVDLPPEEAVSFRKLCSSGGYVLLGAISFPNRPTLMSRCQGCPTSPSSPRRPLTPA
jgi:tryptophan synthase alpha subunit